MEETVRKFKCVMQEKEFTYSEQVKTLRAENERLVGEAGVLRGEAGVLRGEVESLRAKVSATEELKKSLESLKRHNASILTEFDRYQAQVSEERRSVWMTRLIY